LTVSDSPRRHAAAVSDSSLQAQARDLAYSPQASHLASRLGATALGIEALLYGNNPSYPPPFYGDPGGLNGPGGYAGGWGRGGGGLQGLGYGLGSLLNGMGFGSPYSYGYGGAGLQNLGLGLGSLLNGRGFGSPYGYGGGGLLSLAMGLGGLLGGRRGFGLGGLLGLGSLALFGLGRRFMGGGNGGGAFDNWNCSPRPMPYGPRPMPFDGNDGSVNPNSNNRREWNTDSNDSSQEGQMIALINSARQDPRVAQPGTPELQSNPALKTAANWMAGYMQGRSLFNSPAAHNANVPGMVTPADRIRNLGGIGNTYTGECMAEGTSVETVFNMLMACPAHRRIMMDPTYNNVGIKLVGNKWVLDFASV
jgi:uncharacterized protein YkwD